MQSVEAWVGSLDISLRGNDWGQSPSSFTATLGRPLRGSLPASLSALLSSKVNPALAEKLKKAQAWNDSKACPAAVPLLPLLPLSPYAQDWNRSEAIKVLDLVLDKEVGATRVNQLVDLAA